MDGLTDMTKLIVALRKYANAPKEAAVIGKTGNQVSDKHAASNFSLIF